MIPSADSIARARARYAQEVCAGLASTRLEAAFAAVPREDYVGPGPWQILIPEEMQAGYQWTSDADPRRLYRDVLVALDASRGINNGHPSSLAKWIDQLALEPGDRLTHVGCGVGYYTGVMAAMVGREGEVVGIECDSGLAERATRALASVAHAEVVCGDASTQRLHSRDAIFASAGATSPVPWLGALTPGGRLLLPLTVSGANPEIGVGWYLLATRRDAGFDARFVSPVGIYHCIGARTHDGEERLARAFQSGRTDAVRSLSTAPHEPTGACWLHAEGFCLSTDERHAGVS